MRIFIINIAALSLLFTLSTFAQASHEIIGWHWYNQPVIKKQKKKELLYNAFQNYPASVQLKILQLATKDLRAKAVLSGKVGDIANYKRAQDMWVNKATQFTVGWERMLLAFPALNYALKYSHENALAPVMQEDQHLKENQMIEHLSQHHGLLLFYKENQRANLMFANLMQKFSKQHHIALLLVAENKKPNNLQWTNTRFDLNHQRALSLGVSYFPALLLINPKTGTHQIVSYGYKSEDEIASRLLSIGDHWKPDF